ncbi:hypothetical protein [Rufibacter tibetensis]|uniref:Uncharacterized protein n=1 Tax=Rufibacter tibetensis TaxID=512763 RepID=A0A0P0CUQ2_9BACT|nr:hypothetical protein [Rufibacter tibetensis]ALI98100.1 hypothetical protein DC20_02790 [Rufibacter tibetensis]
MDTITLTLTQEHSELVQELLLKTLQEQEVIINHSESTSHVCKRARFHSECTRILLQALQQGYTAVKMPAVLMKPVLSQLKGKLEDQMKIMMDLMKDESLEQENRIQVFMRGIGLLHVMRRMTYEALQIEKEVA